MSQAATTAADRWRAAVPDLTDAEIDTLQGLLGAEPHHLRRMAAVYRAGVATGTRQAASATVHVVEVLGRTDGTYLFADHDQAQRFVAALTGAVVCSDELPVNSSADTLIAAERGGDR